MKLVREHISFERGLDAKQALNVGKRAQIEKWFENIKQQGYKVIYRINDDLSVFVESNLILMGSNITELPDNLTVNGHLDLINTPINKLPDNLIVKGYINLEDTSITELPKNLKVGGSLYLSGTKIAELPDNLTVGHTLDLRSTDITKLPKNLTVGKNLYLNKKIGEIPKDTEVAEQIYRNL